MDSFVEKILSFNGNKYEATVAMSKYAKFLSQKNEDMLDIPLSNNTKEKVTVIAIRDILNGKVKYTLEKESSK
ncbi:MAG: DNA-directed RNA polymerase subunit omega [Brevinematales bacterium]